jgi:hypothetical protein
MRNNLILSGENNSGFGSMMTNGIKDNVNTENSCENNNND